MVHFCVFSYVFLSSVGMMRLEFALLGQGQRVKCWFPSSLWIISSCFDSEKIEGKACHIWGVKNAVRQVGLLRGAGDKFNLVCGLTFFTFSFPIWGKWKEVCDISKTKEAKV